MADFLDVPGFRGVYRYWFLDMTAPVNAVAGNYMFIKLTNQGWVPVYIGIADDLSQRLRAHEMSATAVLFGATHIAAHVQDDLDGRRAEESDLIGRWNPACNTQHRTLKTGTAPGGS